MMLTAEEAKQAAMLRRIEMARHPGDVIDRNFKAKDRVCASCLRPFRTTPTRRLLCHLCFERS